MIAVFEEVMFFSDDNMNWIKNEGLLIWMKKEMIISLGILTV